MADRRHTTGIAITHIAGLLTLLLVVSCSPQISFPPLAPVVATPQASPTANGSLTPRPPATSGRPALPVGEGEKGVREPSATASSQPDEVSSPEPPLTPHLILWTVEAVSPQADGEAGQIFGTGLKAFEKTYPDIPISVVLKNETGKGSVLDYLRTASPVAPSILPDLVVLNTVDLAQAARAGLVVPLEGLISSALRDDLLPATRAAGTVDGQWVGIPFEMDVEHLIYNTNKVASPPIVWTDVISANTTYVFPAKGRNGLVNDAFLIQYLALGGRLQDDEGRPFLDEQALQAVLDYYRWGVENGVIPPEVLTVGAPDEVWPEYVSAQVGMAHVNSRLFLEERDVLRSTQFAAIPTRDGTSLTIGRGRVLAIAAHNPGQQAIAARLIEWLMAPDNNAAWSGATASLPTRYATFKLIGVDDPYWPFLQRQLEVAVPPPAFPEYDQMGRILQQAVVEVLNGEASPEEAATAAVDAIRP